MERKTSRNLYLGGIVLAIIATILIVVASVIVAANTTTGTTGTDSQLPPGVATVFSILTIVAVLLYIVAGILAFISWIGALVKTARLGEWVWFILLLILGGTGIMMLIYIFAGPTQPKAVAASAPGM